jgi:hypothetical protein
MTGFSVQEKGLALDPLNAQKKRPIFFPIFLKYFPEKLK